MVLDSDTRIAEELQYNKRITPKYANLHEWEWYSSNLLTEYRQCIEEGLDIKKYHDLFVAISNLPKDESRSALATSFLTLLCRHRNAKTTPITSHLTWCRSSCLCCFIPLFHCELQQEHVTTVFLLTKFEAPLCIGQQLHTLCAFCFRIVAADRLGAEVSRCTMFDDNITAIATAKKAGMRTVAVYDETAKTSENALKETADRYIYNLKELKMAWPNRSSHCLIR